MMTKGYWIHKNSMDVFYEVLKVDDTHSNHIIINYCCWNKNEYGEPFSIISTYNMEAKIMKKDLKNWRVYVDKYSRI